jgi:hypothetical protein
MICISSIFVKINNRMMKRAAIFIAFALISFLANGQKIIFLHHSTGSGVFWEGRVGPWFENYNSGHGTNYQITDRSYPDVPYVWENYPYDYWNLWINHQCNNTNPNIACLDKIAQDYNVIVFKHCFPGASILADNGNPLVSSNVKTIANYKLQYRALRALMDSYPNNKFIVWTLTPLHRLDTNVEEAARAREFVNWVKNEWLQEDQKDHPNIYIFDFFGLVAESNPTPVNGKVNCLRYEYEIDHNDTNSHPNTLANETVGPVFAQFIVNTIQGQPTVAENVQDNNEIKIFPNPASESFTIDLTKLNKQDVSIEVFDLGGKLVCQESSGNRLLVNINAGTFGNGLYIVKIKTNTFHLRSNLMIVK